MTLDDPLLAERSRIERAQAEPSRFSVLYEENVAAVFAHALRRCGSRSAAEDITSEVFLKALGALPRFEWRGVRYIAYLRKIADRLLADFYVRTAREDPLAEQAEQSMPNDSDGDERVFELVNRLPGDQRMVLALRFAEDRSIAQVAAVLGRSEGAVKQLQHRATTTLRNLLALEDERERTGG